MPHIHVYSFNNKYLYDFIRTNNLSATFINKNNMFLNSFRD